MNTAVINIKTDPATKLKAKEVASELGLSLSGVINVLLKQLIKTKTVTLSVSDEEPSEWMLAQLKDSEEDIKAGRVSPSFDTAEDAIAWLNDPNATYKNGDNV